MRYLIKILSLIAMASILVGCKKDLLETIPNDRISTEIFWKTEKDATLGANAVYIYMSESAEHFIGWDGMSDIVFTNPQPPEAFISQGQFTTLNSRVSGDWNNAYAGIRAANTFLAHVGQGGNYRYCLD